jgi:hypothetical protein
MMLLPEPFLLEQALDAFALVQQLVLRIFDHGIEFLDMCTMHTDLVLQHDDLPFLLEQLAFAVRILLLQRLQVLVDRLPTHPLLETR